MRAVPTKTRHIPGDDGKTYCGRAVTAVACIDKLSDCIDDAECRSCQRSDDRRVRQDNESLLCIVCAKYHRLAGSERCARCVKKEGW